MAKALSLAAAAYKLVWVRVALFVLIPIGTAFLAASEGMDDAKWQALGQFGRAKFCIYCSIPGMVSLAAFLDSSLPRAREKAERLKAAQDLQNMKPEDAP